MFQQSLGLVLTRGRPRDDEQALRAGGVEKGDDLVQRDVKHLNAFPGALDPPVQLEPLPVAAGGMTGLRRPLNRVEGLDLQQRRDMVQRLRTIEMIEREVEPFALLAQRRDYQLNPITMPRTASKQAS